MTLKSVEGRCATLVLNRDDKKNPFAAGMQGAAAHLAVAWCNGIKETYYEPI